MYTVHASDATKWTSHISATSLLLIFCSWARADMVKEGQFPLQRGKISKYVTLRLIPTSCHPDVLKTMDKMTVKDNGRWRSQDGRRCPVWRESDSMGTIFSHASCSSWLDPGRTLLWSGELWSVFHTSQWFLLLVLCLSRNVWLLWLFFSADFILSCGALLINSVYFAVVRWLSLLPLHSKMCFVVSFSPHMWHASSVATLAWFGSCHGQISYHWRSHVAQGLCSQQWLNYSKVGGGTLHFRPSLARLPSPPFPSPSITSPPYLFPSCSSHLFPFPSPPSS